MSKCYFCKIGEIAPGLVSSTTVLDSLIVLTKEVPAKVCGRCGEEYYDREVVSRLEEITDEASGWAWKRWYQSTTMASQRYNALTQRTVLRTPAIISSGSAPFRLARRRIASCVETTN